MRKRLLAIFPLLLEHFAMAQTAPKPTPKPKVAPAPTSNSKPSLKAQQAPSEPKPSPQTRSGQTHATTTLSEFERRDKTLMVGLEMGFTLSFVSGLRAGYFITPNLIAEGSYATGIVSFLGYGGDKTLIEAKLKYFIGNSFYVDLGYSRENWDLTLPIFNDKTFDVVDIKGQVQNDGLGIRIGNQWQWQSFTLGCDWVGAFSAFSTKASFETLGDLEEVQRAREEDDAITNFGGNSAHLLRLYLGWAF